MRIVVLLIALAVLAIAFGLLERRWPSVRGQRFVFRRTGALTDIAWWLFTPTLGKLFSGLVVAASVLALAAIFGVGITADHLRGLSARDTAIGRQSLGLQLFEFLVLADLIAYWQHRAFHSIGRLWRFHAIHHSSTELDWLSSVRVHPLNDALASTAVAAPLLLLGFSPMTLGAYLPFLTLYAIVLHANVSWDLGPLRNIIASPMYHRWHHAADEAALNENFAGLFPVYDRVFGTYFFPRNAAPDRYGVTGEAPPAGFFAQLIYPFKSNRQPVAPETA